jgi:hypothetical protein
VNVPAPSATKLFKVERSEHDVYPSRGLMLRTPENGVIEGDIVDYLLGEEVEAGDEVQITARVVSRVITERRQL